MSEPMRFWLECQGTARRGCGYAAEVQPGDRGYLFRPCPQCGRKQRHVLLTVVDAGELRTYGYHVKRTVAVGDPVVLSEE